MPFTPQQAAALERYFTNLDRPVFALRNLPEVVKGALFSRYSRTEKSLREVLLTEFIEEPESGFGDLVGPPAADDLVAARRAEEFYERVLVGYGDDSVAELAGAHLAVEHVSTLAAKALEDSRIGISPLEKSTRYVRFDRPGVDGRYLYYRGPELASAAYEPAMEALFSTYSELVMPLTESVREAYPMEEGETERGWKSATRAKALDLLRGLLPASTLTNLGLYGNGRAFEYLVTKLSAHELHECRRLAGEMHEELSKVIPAFVRRALDERYGQPAAARMAHIRRRMAGFAAERSDIRRRMAEGGPQVRLLEWDRDAERKVAAAALYPHASQAWEELGDGDPAPLLEALLGDRRNRRDRAPRALEHAQYLFEVEANFGAYRDLHRHRMLTQDRQLLGTSLGFDAPDDLERFGMRERFVAAVDRAAAAYDEVARDAGAELAQYAVPLAFRVRWHLRLNLRELYHLCELRTTPQGHPDYRAVAQEMFKRVQEVHPNLAWYAKFVDLGPGDELERRASERRLDLKLRAR
ncbi:MAG TPA: FAD-dependent thymidylate synthase [Candidatus Dormibacteraeota bacterium]